jgi:hypothetical protein
VSNEFAMSRNARCLAEGYVERFKALPKHTFTLHHDAFHPEGGLRKFVRVLVNGQDYWADAITGSLYEVKGGRCLSGVGRIDV